MVQSQDQAVKLMVAREAVGRGSPAGQAEHSHSDWSSRGRQWAAAMAGQLGGESKDGDSFTSFCQMVEWMWSSRVGCQQG